MIVTVPKGLKEVYEDLINSFPSDWKENIEVEEAVE